MYELLIPFLTFLSVVAVGGAVLAARAARRKPLQARLGATGTSIGEARPLQSGTPKLIEIVGEIGTKVASGGPSATLRQNLATAGYHVDHSARVYVGAKILLLIIGLTGLTALLLPLQFALPLKAIAIVTGAAALSFVPNIVVFVRRQNRRTEVRRHLPDALDLLEICVSSGMGLDAAWNSVADQIRNVSPILADEMALTNLEIHLGAQRAVAMRHMAERTQADELASLVAVLIQSERFGTSIATALRTFSESMREVRSSQAEVAAERMAVTLLFPMVLFIFPTILIVTVGPAAVVLVDIMGSR